MTVPFTLDATQLAGHDIVAFEAVTCGDTVVATHEDIEDGGQTVRVVSIGTCATDKADGDHAVAATEAEVVDAVSYRGLTPGEEYAMTGTLIDRETGRAVADASGKPVTSSVTFTPAEADGEVALTFIFDASQLGGHEVVAFEVLTKGGVTIATHEDLNDEAQTVRVESPKVPEESGRLPWTGNDDGVGPMAFAIALIGAGLLSLGAIVA